MRKSSKKIPKTDARLAVGYVRVSTDEQALGPVAQRAALERWAAARAIKLVAVFEDIGVSGGAELDDRPGLLAAIAAIEAHGAGILVAAKRDRLARDVMLAAMIERLAGRAGARVQTADCVGEGDDPASALMRTMVDAFAAYERALIRSRTKAALAVKKSRGERIGSVPYGFKLATDGEHLVPEPSEQAVIARARTLRDSGLSFRAISGQLEAAGVLPRIGTRWHAPQVQRMIE